nr:MAG TPA: integrase [Caudoviricetes sp.]
MERKIQTVEFVEQVPRLKNVVAYVRVSTGKDAMIHSLSAQVSHYNRLIQNHPGWKYCGVYVDEAVTGTKINRPDFLRMINDCRQGKIDIILTKSISRFARNTVTLLETVRELKQLGVDVIFEEQNINTLSTDGELMMTILASYAQEESLSVSENMKWKVRNKFGNGIPWNGTLLGYRIKNNKYEVVEKEAEIIKLIYKLYLSGLGYEAIANELKSRGYVTRNGNEWSHSSVLWILHNYSYTGNLMLQTTFTENHITKKYRFNKGEYPMYHAKCTHEPIVSIELFNAVQEESIRRSKRFGRPENKNQTELTGRVYCGKCGKRCRRKIRHGKPVWICNTYNMKGKGACDAKAVPEEVLLSFASERAIEKITIYDNNELKILLKNGNVITEKWLDKSRSESWTAEMKLTQSERMKELWNSKEQSL